MSETQNKNEEIIKIFKTLSIDEKKEIIKLESITHIDESSTDLMNESIGPNKIPLYDGKGFAELIDIMPRLVPKGRFADMAVVQSARISYGGIMETIAKDNNLIKFLWANKHSTPFESVSFQIRVRVPIFVARQLMRHRLFSYNEISYRYQQPKEEFYYPDVRFQDDINRQMSKDNNNLSEEEKAKLIEINDGWSAITSKTIASNWMDYKDMVDNNGVAREVARTILPVSLMTEILVKGNARTWLHFLKLRLEKDAQSEIRDLAEAIVKLIEPRIPTTWKTFMDYDINNLDLSGPQVKCIAEINTSNCINECGKLVDIERYNKILKSHGITGGRKITEFLDILEKLHILCPGLHTNNL